MTKIHKNFFKVERYALDAIDSLKMEPENYVAFIRRVEGARTIKELRQVIHDVNHGCAECAGNGYYAPAKRVYVRTHEGIWHGYLCEQCRDNSEALSIQTA